MGFAVARRVRFPLGVVVAVVITAALCACGSSTKPSASNASGAGTSQVNTSTTTPLNRDGPFAVGKRVETFVDASRKTPANGSVAAKPSRTLETIIEYPTSGPPDPTQEVSGAQPLSGPFPVVVYVHGLGAHADNPYLHPWAAAGFVAVAPKFPLTNRDTPGGVNFTDIANEPADVSFVLSQLSRLPARDADLQRAINANMIGVMGASSGASVAYMLAFAPTTRDNRIGAVIEQSGGCLVPCPADTFPVAVTVPLMVMNGTADLAALVQWSAEEYAAAHSPKYLVSLIGAHHVQYDEPWLSTSVRASIDFFARYLKGQDDGISRLRHNTTEPGRVARLQQG